VLLTSSAGAVVTVVNWIDCDPRSAPRADCKTVSVAPMSLTLNVTAAGFGSQSEIGAILDASTGETLTPTAKGSDSVVVTLKTRAHANFVVFPKKK
jgi:hypothetical protein